MPWPIVLYASREEAKAQLGFVPVGAMYPHESEAASTAQWYEWYHVAVAKRYLREHMHLRPPYVVQLPCGTDFCVDFCSSPEIHSGGGEGWSYEGDAPLITMKPSIRIGGGWHGYITDGVISDDVDGRTFPDAVGVPQ